MLDKTFHLSEFHLHNERVELDGFQIFERSRIPFITQKSYIIPTIQTDKNTSLLVLLCEYLLGIIDLIRI